MEFDTVRRTDHFFGWWIRRQRNPCKVRHYRINALQHMMRKGNSQDFSRDFVPSSFQLLTRRRPLRRARRSSAVSMSTPKPKRWQKPTLKRTKAMHATPNANKKGDSGKKFLGTLLDIEVYMTAGEKYARSFSAWKHGPTKKLLVWIFIRFGHVRSARQKDKKAEVFFLTKAFSSSGLEWPKKWSPLLTIEP